MRTEKSIVKSIQIFLREIGAWEYKVLGTGYSRQGVPDLIVCYRGFFIGLEVKRLAEVPTKIQLYELEMIRYAGGVSEVVRSVMDVKHIINNMDIIIKERKWQ